MDETPVSEERRTPLAASDQASAPPTDDEGAGFGRTGPQMPTPRGWTAVAVVCVGGLVIGIAVGRTGYLTAGPSDFGDNFFAAIGQTLLFLALALLAGVAVAIALAAAATHRTVIAVGSSGFALAVILGAASSALVTPPWRGPVWTTGTVNLGVEGYGEFELHGRGGADLCQTVVNGSTIAEIHAYSTRDPLGQLQTVKVWFGDDPCGVTRHHPPATISIGLPGVGAGSYTSMECWSAEAVVSIDQVSTDRLTGTLHFSRVSAASASTSYAPPSEINGSLKWSCEAAPPR